MSGLYHRSTTNEEFRALLDWWMCSDPWPVRNLNTLTSEEQHARDDNKKHVDAFLARESNARGYAGVVEAFHEFKVPT